MIVDFQDGQRRSIENKRHTHTAAQIFPFFTKTPFRCAFRAVFMNDIVMILLVGSQRLRFVRLNGMFPLPFSFVFLCVYLRFVLHYSSSFVFPPHHFLILSISSLFICITAYAVYSGLQLTRYVLLHI